eukprot:4000425-Pyramimonas_sp.AAC.1
MREAVIFAPLGVTSQSPSAGIKTSNASAPEARFKRPVRPAAPVSDASRAACDDDPAAPRGMPRGSKTFGADF